MCTVTDTGVPIERQSWDEEEQQVQSDVQEQAEKNQEDELQSNKPTEAVKETEDNQSSKMHSTNTSDGNTDTAPTHFTPTTATTKPAVPRRPKVPPKPSIPAACRTDNTTSKATPRAKSLDTQTVLQNKPPVPKPRAKTPSYDEGRHSCSPVFDDELDSKQVPPAKPPRRRSAQIRYTRSLSDTPSPVANRAFFPATLPSTFAVDENREILSPPLPPLSQSKPALPPKPRRRSSSTSTVGLEPPLVAVAENLNIDDIDLSCPPYSTTVSGCLNCKN